MNAIDINPLVDAIQISFICSKCHVKNETELISVPIPNLGADTHSDSERFESYEHTCSCGKVYNIEISCGFYGGEVYVDEDAELLEVNEFSSEEDSNDPFDEDYFDEHIKDTMKALKDVDGLPVDSKKLLYRVLYANIISSMEAFLCDTLIQRVLSNEDTKRHFVECFKDFSEEKIPISQVFQCINNLDSRIKMVLREIIFHNLPRVKNIYKTTLGVDLGNIQGLMECVGIRHDIVHRNGNDKNGNLRDITQSDVEDLAALVSELIHRINSAFLLIDHPEYSRPDGSIELPF